MSTEGRRVLVFLSYSRRDDEPFARRLYEDLTQSGFDVWWDRKSMPSRGEPFTQEIRDAIHAADRLLLVLGPAAAISSEWCAYEWNHALEFGRAINPVLRIGDLDQIPSELKFIDTRDFRSDAAYATEFETLVRQLSEPVAPMGKLVAVPSLPAHLLTRPDRLRAVKDALLIDLHHPVVAKGAATRTGIHGMGGIGKSVMAALLARDPEVRRAFPDGIVWLQIGPKPPLVERLREAAKALDDPGNFATVPEGKAKLGEVLAGRAVLLVLDDVWHAADADAFDVLGPRSRMVFTTRDAGLVVTLGATQYQVPLLSEHEALELLARAVGDASARLPAEAREIVTECECHTLAVALCGGMARRGFDWKTILGALRAAALKRIADPRAMNEQHRSLWVAMQVSIDALSPDWARRFAELSVFPSHETVPEAAVRTLWAHTGNIDDFDADELFVNLSERSLVRLDAAPVGAGETRVRRVSLHLLLQDYATQIAGDRGALQRSLLDAYHAKCPEGWPSGPVDGYFHTHLREHLVAAGRGAELADLLHDFAWLEAKAGAGMAFDLPRDFRAAIAALPPEDDRRRILGLLEEALRRDVHMIARHPTTLLQCLWNSCWWYDCPDAAKHYLPPEGPGPHAPAPWDGGGPKLHDLLERWRGEWEDRSPRAVWLRSLRPPVLHLGTAQRSVLRGHDVGVTSVAWSPDGRQVATGSGDRTVRVWDAETGEERRCLRGHAGGVESVAWSPDGRQVASGSWDETVRVWDAETAEERRCLRGGHRNYVFSVAWSPDGRQVASGSVDRTARVWDAETGDELRCLRGHERVVRSVAWSPDGRQLASGSVDRTVRVWDVETGEERRCLRGHEHQVTSVAWSRDGGQVASGSRDKTARVWDAETGDELRCLRGHEILRGHESWVRSMAWSPNGRQVASGSDDQTVRVWDVGTGEERRCLRGHEGWIVSVAWSPDGRQVASGSWDETVRVWDAETAEERRCLRGGHRNYVFSVAWSPDGRQVASGSVDRTARVWDAETGDELRCLRGHERVVRSVAWSPDGRQLASGSVDRTVRVWDVETGEERRCLRGHEGWVERVAWSPDGLQVASGSHDKTVRVWDAETGACLKVLPGSGDAAVVARAFATSGPVLLGRGGETVLLKLPGEEELGWFEDGYFAGRGRTWAGHAGHHVFILRVEGRE